MPLRKESKRGLIALAVLCIVGLATFASMASSSGGGKRESITARLLRAR